MINNICEFLDGYLFDGGHNLGNLHNMAGLLSTLDRQTSLKFLFRLGFPLCLDVFISRMCRSYLTIGTVRLQENPIERQSLPNNCKRFFGSETTAIQTNMHSQVFHKSSRQLRCIIKGMYHATGFPTFSVLHEQIVQISADTSIVQKEGQTRRCRQRLQLFDKVFVLYVAGTKLQAIIIKAEFSHRHDRPVGHTILGNLT
mmetsp:Transcript_16207/g.30865  ORF Transcript_16207/g.30865 Transcript_16207/m.30865 type:complete len:200 (-) Transcript_16207:1344-1943(-)